MPRIDILLLIEYITLPNYMNDDIASMKIIMRKSLLLPLSLSIHSHC